MKSLNLVNGFALSITILAVSGTARADLNRAVTIDADIAKGMGKPTVLIYYANESHENAETKKNTDAILAHLRSSDHEGVQELVDTIERDRVNFAKVVGEEVAAIKTAVARGDVSGVVIFTNEMVSRGQFQFATAGGRELTTATIRLPKLDDFVYQSHPLAHAEVLRAALQAAAERFSPSEHEFVLVTKSHGSHERAMIPRIGLHADDTTRQ